ncbi:carbon-monoxide dehydrogenase small subunit [Kibdelosporangium banguiense]|uniref:Carbon-monoxide dehydrogenase small subunit n=1 Tax=Kibdelosporangium banguiense TaxID=1365924 RepID=A0ABS4TU17_9PSEU|nr:(2Fe-2S)-binding protein [Kibdelosporangium banguiense]MBP2327872.1 carbon-monoxide dehydrogenase small subunit [Kibdelosporangium banguiense]
MTDRDITVTVDGKPETAAAQDRTLLVHWLRDALDKRGPKIGCDTGNCGACTVRWDGALVKSCMVLAVQADGDTVETAAGLSEVDGSLNRVQQCFKDHHALQCGYCTSGMLMTATDFLDSGESVTEETTRRAIKGNICRCTGYHNIVQAIRAAASPEERL